MNASVLDEFERDSQVGDNIHMSCANIGWYCDIDHTEDGFHIERNGGSTDMLTDGEPLVSLLGDIFRDTNVKMQDIVVVFNSLDR